MWLCHSKCLPCCQAHVVFHLVCTVQNFEKQHEQEEWRVNPENLEEFVNLWWVMKGVRIL